MGGITESVAKKSANRGGSSTGFLRKSTHFHFFPIAIFGVRGEVNHFFSIISEQAGLLLNKAKGL